jgi:hypothetical protein
MGQLNGPPACALPATRLYLGPLTSCVTFSALSRPIRWAFWTIAFGGLLGNAGAFAVQLAMLSLAR